MPSPAAQRARVRTVAPARDPWQLAQEASAKAFLTIAGGDAQATAGADARVSAEQVAVG